MKFQGAVVLVYGMIVMLFGLIGYLFSDSLPSLIMGSCFGALLIAGGMGIFRSSIIGYFISLGATVLLTLFFGYKFSQTGAYYPSGSLALLSALILILLLTSRVKRGTGV
jgi:uncharacterized membrane protein (UPF0136 family)